MPVFLCHKIPFREVSISPAFILEGCGTREAVKKFRGHVFSRWFSITVSLLSAVRQKDQKLIPVYYCRINRIACRDGIMAVFTGENLCIPFRDPDGGQVWDDLCRFLKEKNPSIAVCG